MLINHEPDRNIEDVTDTEIYDAIRYLEPDPKSAKEMDDDDREKDNGAVIWFGCTGQPFSTLSTPSTVLVLNLLGKFLDLALLSFLSALVCDLPLQEGCNRVTYAPESTRRLSGHISPQPSSVPIQARQ